MDGLIVMDSIIKDIRYGVRGLLKHPGFTAIVVITLALGIGASTAIFSVVDNVLLRRLPYRNANRVVAIEEMNREGKLGQVTSANFLDWRAQNTVFEQLAAIKTTTSNLALQDHAERIDLAQTNANFVAPRGTPAVRSPVLSARRTSRTRARRDREQHPLATTLRIRSVAG